MTTDYVNKWLLDNHVAEELFDPQTTHYVSGSDLRDLPVSPLTRILQELVRRGYDFLRLFHTKNTLEDRHLDMLWGMACLGKHESLEVWVQCPCLLPLLTVVVSCVTPPHCSTRST
jgi:hypothetical protein